MDNFDKTDNFEKWTIQKKMDNFEKKWTIQKKWTILNKMDNFEQNGQFRKN